MHAAFADDAVQIVKETVNRRPSLLGMNAPVRALIGLLHFALTTGMKQNILHDIPAPPWARDREPLGRTGSQPRQAPALRIKDSTSRLAGFARKSAARWTCHRGPDARGSVAIGGIADMNGRTERYCCDARPELLYFPAFRSVVSAMRRREFLTLIGGFTAIETSRACGTWMDTLGGPH